MMKKSFFIFKSLILFMIPYFTLYAIYIQLNGVASSGGGFQAGTIFASEIIAFDLVSSKKKYKILSTEILIICGSLGLLIYLFTGFFSFIFDDNYLNYNSISKAFNINDYVIGQHIGIFCIEIGICLTVSSVITLIYLIIKQKSIL